MVVGFTTTYAIGTYHYQCCELEAHSGDTTLCDKISLSVTCNRSVVFSGTPISSNNKTNRHDLTEILLKVALNTINQQIPPTIFFAYCRISGVMISVLAASATDRGFETRVYKRKE